MQWSETNQLNTCCQIQATLKIMMLLAQQLYLIFIHLVKVISQFPFQVVVLAKPVDTHGPAFLQTGLSQTGKNIGVTPSSNILTMTSVYISSDGIFPMTFSYFSCVFPVPFLTSPPAGDFCVQGCDELIKGAHFRFSFCSSHFTVWNGKAEKSGSDCLFYTNALRISIFIPMNTCFIWLLVLCETICVHFGKIKWKKEKTHCGLNG